jgi:hypothetical protein
VRRVITDQAHGSAAALTIRAPETWTVAGRIMWHYDSPNSLVTLTARAVNPANIEAVFFYPTLRMQWTEVSPQYRQYLKGKQSQAGARGADGTTSMPPQPPIKVLVAFVKQARPNAKNLKFEGQQDLPGLADALKIPAAPGNHGVAVKVSYDLNGQPVEEAFFGVYYSVQSGNPATTIGSMSMPANAIKQTNWGFEGLQSFRGPAGKVDARMSVFCLISKSLVINPTWQNLVNQIQAQLVAAISEKLKQGQSQLLAGQAAMQQMQAQEKAMNSSVASFDAKLRSPGFDDSWLRTSSGGSGGGSGRSSSDHFDDNIRGKDTMNDSSTGGTTQLSNAGQYHFTDGFGNYRTSDVPNYTPGAAGESGSWTQMTVAQ